VIAVRDRWKRLREDQSGLSMAEILVAMMLSMLILVMVTSFFIQVGKITTSATQIRESNGNASNVANEITSVLRVATNLPKLNSATADSAIVAGTRSSLTIYSLSNTSATAPAPVKVTFALDTAGVVTETRCVGNLSGNYYTFSPCASTSTRTIGTGVLAATGVADQLFTYRDANGTALVLATNGTGSISGTQIPLVGSITVTVRTLPKNSKTRPVIISNTVVLRNVGLDTGT
jgi:Tfp pilus assembly protein PilW